MEILNVQNLNFKYALGNEEVLRDISFTVDEGDFVAICGPTGCGKSTLLKMIKRELTPHGEKSGKISFAGIELEEALSPAEKLKVVQKLMEEGAPEAADVYRGIGCYLAHTLALYHALYGFRHVLLLGRVMSGKGGDLLLEECRKVLEDEYPELNEKISLDLPDEKFRRLGQSAAAASLPEIEK